MTVLVAIEAFLAGLLVMAWLNWRAARRNRQRFDEALDQLTTVQESVDNLVTLLADPPEPPLFEGPS